MNRPVKDKDPWHQAPKVYEYTDKRSITEEDCQDIWLGHLKWRDLEECRCEELEEELADEKNKRR